MSIRGVDAPDFPSSIPSFADVQFLSLGVLGEYLGRVYQEIDRRPICFAAKRIGWPGAVPNAAVNAKS